MANITPSAPSNAGALAPFAATTPGGDEIVYNGGDLMIEFNNGHASSITVQFVPTQSSKKVAGAGRVNIPTRSLAIAAGAHGVFRFGQEDVNAYVNAAGRIPITYTGGNAAMTMRAFRT